MKHLTVFLFSTLFFPAVHSQTKKDSLILKRAFLPEGGYEVVFVERNKTSKFYSQLAYPLTEGTTEQLQQIRQRFPIKARHLGNSWYAQRWVPLNRYKNKYYLYFPSDAAASPALQITDSTVNILTFDNGIVCSVITGFDASSPVTQLEYVNLSDGKSSMKLHVIDRKNEIVVFEYDVYGTKQYQLMVSAKKIKNFPMIVISNTEGKTEGWTFDTIAYSKILKDKKIN